MLDSPLRASVLFLRFLQQDWGAWTPWGRIKRQQRHIHDLLQAEIEERRTKGNEERADVLSLMMAVRDENGQAMTDAELRDELLSILIANELVKIYDSTLPPQWSASSSMAAKNPIHMEIACLHGCCCTTLWGHF